MRYVAIYVFFVVFTLWLNLALSRPLALPIMAGVAESILKGAEACAAKVGLPLGNGDVAREEWGKPEKQRALRECLREKGESPTPESSRHVPAFPSRPQR